MFLLHLQDNTPISSVEDSSNPAYSPIYLELDSTDAEPAPSSPAKCYLSLPAGYVCLREASLDSGGALITREGTTATYWDFTTDDPALNPNPMWSSSIRVDILNNIPTEFWVRSRTVYGEVPIDDRSVALKVSGEIEKVD